MESKYEYEYVVFWLRYKNSNFILNIEGNLGGFYVIKLDDYFLKIVGNLNVILKKIVVEFWNLNFGNLEIFVFFLVSIFIKLFFLMNRNYYI